jgi:alkanesulfonate monooxygenase SsuD/methylene tetrahydromethanopterin reductase-like flavin-dependent oxidoreductase (luciferase family)
MLQRRPLGIRADRRLRQCRYDSAVATNTSPQRPTIGTPESIRQSHPAITFGAMLQTFPQSTPLAWNNVVQSARLVESLGFSKIWVWDHLDWHGPNFECVSTVSSLLALTNHISVGPGVVQLPLRNHHTLTHELNSLSTMFPGRVHLGVGAGRRPEEFERVGANFQNRWPNTVESARHLRSKLTIDGPIWVGGLSRAALRLAAEMGGWIPTFADPAEIADGLKQISDMATIRKPPAVTAVVFVGPGGDPVAGSKWTASLYGMATFPERRLAPGNKAGLAELAERYVEAGVSQLVFAIADDAPDETFHWIVDSVGHLQTPSDQCDTAPT